MSTIIGEQSSVQTKNLTSVIFNDVTHSTQICYHLIYPRNFNLVKRPKRTAQSNGGNAIVKKRRRRGRPRKDETKKQIEERRIQETTVNNEKLNEQNLKIPCSRTRSGRVSRPPKHMSKFVEIKDSKIVASNSNNVIPVKTEIPVNGFTEMPDFINLNSVNDMEMPFIKYENTVPLEIPETKKIRKNLAQFTCGVCKKVKNKRHYFCCQINKFILLKRFPFPLQVYLGRKKLLKHYITFPEHKTQENSFHSQTSNSSQIDLNESFTNGAHSYLFDELMKMVTRVPNGERVPSFLAEVSNFVYKVRSLKSKLLSPKSMDIAEAVTPDFFVDKNVAKVLNIPEGRTQMNEHAFDEHSQEQQQQHDQSFSEFINDVDRPPSNMSSMSSNLQQLGYNLNLFPPVTYDHISDNAVEAEVLEKIHSNVDVINDMTHESQILDLFSFNNLT